MTTPIIFYSLLIFLMALMGSALPLLVPQLKENGLKLFVSLGAGLLLGMSILHMLPEAAEMIPATFSFWFLFGFVLLLILERFFMVHPCDEHGCHYHTVGIAAFSGLTVHGVIEGFALASSLYVAQLGPLVLIAILAHKAPQGFALTSILKLAKKSHRQIMLFAVGVALSGPLGVALAFGLIQLEKMPSAAGVLLAISAGTFLYIAACDLIPELHRSDSEKFKRLAAFVLGLLLAYGSGHFMGEHPGHHHSNPGSHKTTHSHETAH